ncbi:MAG: leucine-rich repeat domain-containing protein, partial [Ruminococcus sp.]|nr:leucine-rich repeat domain-containing protein [Ruminococcus sp.]
MKKFTAAALAAALCMSSVTAVNVCAVTVNTDGISAAVSKTAIEGKCGENVFYEYDGGKLVIKGTGPMGNWDSAGVIPWADYRKEITSVEICEGVTTTGACGFSFLSNLTSVSFPQSLTTTGMSSFEGCFRLESIDLPANVTTVGLNSFRDCPNLKRVV